MLALLFAAAIVAAPAPTKAARLTAYVIRINPRAAPYAKRLAGCLIMEAKRHRIDLPLFVAVAHTESHFKRDCKGTSWEYGVFQLWPWARYLRPAFDRLRAAYRGLPGFRDKDWNHLHRQAQIRASRDVCLSAYLAADLLAYHVAKGRRHSPRVYARYNSGGPRVRPGYVRALRRRSRAVRRALRGE